MSETAPESKETIPDISPITADLVAYAIDGGFCSLCYFERRELVPCTTVPNRWVPMMPEFVRCDRGHLPTDTVPCVGPLPCVTHEQPASLG